MGISIFNLFGTKFSGFPDFTVLLACPLPGVQLAYSTSVQFHYRRAAISSQFKSKIGNILAKAAALRITLNIDGAPLASRSHTDPDPISTSKWKKRKEGDAWYERKEKLDLCQYSLRSLREFDSLTGTKFLVRNAR